MYAVPGSDKDPVAAYEFYAEKRPVEMNEDDAPFYLAINNCSKQGTGKPWFKKNAVGVNKLNGLMKTMAEKAGISTTQLNLANHSGRKTMMQTLTKKNIPPTDIIQLSGHKNLQSVNNYAIMSEKQQIEMSRTLCGLTTRTVSKESSSCNVVDNQQNNSLTTFNSATSSVDSRHGQQALSLFSGAVIHGGQFSIKINSLNQSPTLSQAVESLTALKRYKRIKVLSDSDSD
ncbi:uncharacterized protein LOC116291027 [Actinia tenebrosa]|uniref:Uncharacterized protein LOC116291027 n=1 Tax=Actinia tenebrosa TaxID=6105 RepID=A0A6P8HMX6_ACTTE|nr:uncharacterized protein LOC116291027 [Actinia tenebrosa]